VTATDASVRGTPTCPHCAAKPRTQSGDYVSPTCGASECQESEYRANRERNLRRKRKS
jgi:hypothetical protein